MAIARTPETAAMARPIRSKGTRTAGHNGHELRGGEMKRAGKHCHRNALAAALMLQTNNSQSQPWPITSHSD